MGLTAVEQRKKALEILKSEGSTHFFDYLIEITTTKEQRANEGFALGFIKGFMANEEISRYILKEEGKLDE